MKPDGAVRWRSLLVEFVLLVTGVVVALAVDGWVADRSDRETEVYYLAQLSRDVAESEEQLRQGLLERLAGAREAGIQVLPYLRNGEAALTPDQLVVRLFHASRAYGDYSQAYADAVYESLRSTGDLRLLKDRDLRDRIIAFYAEGERNGFLLATHPVDYRRLVREKLPWDVQQEIRNACPVRQKPPECTVDLSGVEVDEFLDSMRSNREVTEALNLLLTRLEVTIPSLQRSQAEARRLLRQLN